MPQPKVDKDLKTQGKRRKIAPPPAPIVVVAEKVQEREKNIAAKCHHECEEGSRFEPRENDFVCACAYVCVGVFAVKMQNVCMVFLRWSQRPSLLIVAIPSNPAETGVHLMSCMRTPVNMMLGLSTKRKMHVWNLLEREKVDVFGILVREHAGIKKAEKLRCEIFAVRHSQNSTFAEQLLISIR
jgi:hypothetical protein